MNHPAPNVNPSDDPKPPANQLAAMSPPAIVQAFIDGMPAPMAVIDAAGRILAGNALAATAGLHVGRHIPDGPIKVLVAQTLASGPRLAPEGEASQIRCRDEHGTEHHYLPTVAPLLDDAGHVAAIAVSLKVMPDNSGKDSRSELISRFSHELKTPLTSIQMAIHLLIEDAADRLAPRQMEMLQAARDDVDRLYVLMEQILAEARRTW